jgi:hypothetical protein
MKNLEFNKIAAAVLLGGVIAMVSGTIARLAFGEYSHHEEKRGFQIEVADDNSGGEGAPAAQVDMGTLLAAATVAQVRPLQKNARPAMILPRAARIRLVLIFTGFWAARTRTSLISSILMP